MAVQRVGRNFMLYVPPDWSGYCIPAFLRSLHCFAERGCEYIDISRTATIALLDSIRRPAFHLICNISDIGFCPRLWVEPIQLDPEEDLVFVSPCPDLCTNKIKTNSVAFSLQANYTDWAIATGRRILVPNFADRVVSRGQRGGTLTVVNLSFLDQEPLYFLSSSSSFILTRIRLMEKSNDLVANRNRNLPACSAMPYPSMLPRQ
jgi:hypothetical protein